MLIQSARSGATIVFNMIAVGKYRYIVMHIYIHTYIHMSLFIVLQQNIELSRHLQASHICTVCVCVCVVCVHV